MTADSKQPEASARTTAVPWPWIAAVVLLVLGGLSVIAWRGCGLSGAQSAAQAEAEEKRKQEEEAEKQKQIDPKPGRFLVLPGDPEVAIPPVKPGHWVTSTQRQTAVYQDFVGQSQLSVVNGQNEIYPVPGTPLAVRATRPVALFKGRPKDIENTFLVPDVNRSVQVATELTKRGFGDSIRQRVGTLRMPSYQYQFVILAKEPNRYGFVKTLDSVEVPFDGESDFDSTEDPVHYRVVTPAVDRVIPLPDNALTWTTIAYLLWDEVDPALFTAEQERALTDWLHWGGQLIISGPDSLDLLKGSFLEPLLPATSGGSRAVAADDPALAELNRGWMISPRRGASVLLAPTVPWSGVKLNVRPKGRAIWSTGGLLVERAVGRGRIVVSAVQLAERDLINWSQGFESLFNACLLRRPRRKYEEGNFGDVTLSWVGPEFADRRLDAKLTTGMRYLARDVGVDTNYHWVDADTGNNQLQLGPYANQQRIQEHHAPDHAGGIGAWNDFSATANAARDALAEAAGVEVPGTSFVVLCLAAYLIVLVPLNWLLFQALGRIEWAWVAAPVIAIVGTWVIVDRARLDIGFVRAHTEIGLLELQPEYDRGHLARYTGLYSSLSTTYDLDFDSLTAVAAPFSIGGDPNRISSAGSSRGMVDYQRYDKVRLAGVFVSSNSTNMVHSEQMFPLDGAIRLGKSSRNRPQIENRSQLHLQSVAAIQRSTREDEEAGRKGLRGTWIGELRPGESAPVTFPPLVMAKDKVPFADERADEERLQNVERLNLEPTFRLALDIESFEPGEKRLVARVDGLLSGESVSPAASQVRGATLVVAHLEYAPLPDPRPDLNTRRDVTNR